MADGKTVLTKPNDIVKKAVDTIRVISAEVISAANSGHSGIALGAAPIMYSVYTSMKIDSDAPDWFNRDRFILSAGHGSALLYTVLHFMGFKISTEDLKTFRTLNSHLTGHPELNTKIGVDCSTGPLGQGVAMAVGAALAEKRLAEMFNKDGFNIIDHHTFVLAGDGCLMEGVSYEACNLAGLWKLNKLIMLYDSNHVTLDGKAETANGEDTAKRFEACGWRVISVSENQGTDGITSAIAQAKTSADAPTVIIVNTTIGFGARTAGTSKAHGAVLSAAETQELRERLQLPGKPLEVDSDVRKHFSQLIKNQTAKKKWDAVVSNYKKKYPAEYKDLIKFISPEAAQFIVTPERKTMSLRDAGHTALNQIAKQSPRIYGGSADVASTTKAFVDGAYFACGVREFAMAAICNGLALHGFTPYCSTFLAFSDYARAAIRLSALMDLPVTYIFTHDGFGNGPDGPTHQGNEHISALRLMPNMNVFRPCDDAETAAAFKYVFEKRKPACIVLGRGEVPPISGEKDFGNVEKGGYVISAGSGECKAVLIATGAEVATCIEAQKLLEKSGVGVRVVSIPSFELFDLSSAEYKSNVLGGGLPKVAVETGVGALWHKYISADYDNKDNKSGLNRNRIRSADYVIVSFDQFGGSGPNGKLAEKFGFTAENITRKTLELLGRVL